MSKEINEDTKLHSLNPEEILTKLNLDRSALASAKAAADRGDQLGALAALRTHYRTTYPLPSVSRAESRRGFEVADRIVKHIFQWGPYEEADYGAGLNSRRSRTLSESGVASTPTSGRY